MSSFSLDAIPAKILNVLKDFYTFIVLNPEDQLLNTSINIRMCKVSGLFFADHHQMIVCIINSYTIPG